MHVRRFAKICLSVFLVLSVSGCFLSVQPPQISSTDLRAPIGVTGVFHSKQQTTNGGTQFVETKTTTEPAFTFSMWEVSAGGVAGKKDKPLRVRLVDFSGSSYLGVLEQAKDAHVYLIVQLLRDDFRNGQYQQMNVGVLSFQKGALSNQSLRQVIQEYGLQIKDNGYAFDISGNLSSRNIVAFLKDKRVDPFLQVKIDSFVRGSTPNQSASEQSAKVEAPIKNSVNTNSNEKATCKRLIELCGVICTEVDGEIVYRTQNKKYWYYESGRLLPTDRYPNICSNY